MVLGESRQKRVTKVTTVRQIGVFLNPRKSTSGYKSNSYKAYYRVHARVQDVLIPLLSYFCNPNPTGAKTNLLNWVLAPYAEKGPGP